MCDKMADARDLLKMPKLSAGPSFCPSALFIPDIFTLREAGLEGGGGAGERRPVRLAGPLKRNKAKDQRAMAEVIASA
jgi:hypothetical protein